MTTKNGGRPATAGWTNNQVPAATRNDGARNKGQVSKATRNGGAKNENEVSEATHNGGAEKIKMSWKGPAMADRPKKKPPDPRRFCNEHFKGYAKNK